MDPLPPARPGETAPRPRSASNATANQNLLADPTYNALQLEINLAKSCIEVARNRSQLAEMHIRIANLSPEDAASSLATAESSLEQAKGSLQEAKCCLEQAESSSERAKGLLEEDIHEKDAQIAELANVIRTLHAEPIGYQARIQLEQRNGGLQEQIHQLQNQLRESRHQVEETSDLAESAERAQRSSEETIHERDTKIAELTDIIRNLRADQDGYKVEMQQKDTLIAGAANMLLHIRADSQGYDAQIEHLRQNGELQQQVNDLEGQLRMSRHEPEPQIGELKHQVRMCRMELEHEVRTSHKELVFQAKYQTEVNRIRRGSLSEREEKPEVEDRSTEGQGPQTHPRAETAPQSNQRSNHDNLHMEMVAAIETILNNEATKQENVLQPATTLIELLQSDASYESVMKAVGALKDALNVARILQRG